MIRIVSKIRQYLNWYGYRGLILAAKSLLIKRSTKVRVRPRGISHSLALRTRSSDLSTYHQIFISSAYEIQLRAAPSLIIDGGGNVGFAAIYFTNRYPHAKVLTLEPEAANFDLLVENVRPYPSIVPLRAALWKENVDVEITDPGHGHWGYRVGQKPSAADRMKGNVCGITINKLLRDYGVESVDILKLDIEGAEKAVFEDPSGWISKVGVIIIELHEDIAPGCTDAVYRAVAGFGFEARRGENLLFARDEYVPDRSLEQPWTRRVS